MKPARGSSPMIAVFLYPFRSLFDERYNTAVMASSLVWLGNAFAPIKVYPMLLEYRETAQRIPYNKYMKFEIQTKEC